MSDKEKQIYPGELLKEARKKKRRRFRKLASELGIPEKYLEALEENYFSSMAGPTYIRGYLRAYSKKLDLDPEKVLKGYERYLRDQRKEEKQAKRIERKQKLTLPYIIAAIIGLIILFLIFIPN